jgi:hypothetical protein
MLTFTCMHCCAKVYINTLWCTPVTAQSALGRACYSRSICLYQVLLPSALHVNMCPQLQAP